MTRGERVKEIRKSLSLTLEKFGERLGVGKTAISKIEKNENNLTEQTAKAICREFNVNYIWLTTGEGETFDLPEDEEAAYVSELLEDIDNPLYDLIKSIMKTYSESGEKEKTVLKSFANNLLENIKKESD